MASCRERWCGKRHSEAAHDPLFTLETLEREKRTLTLARLGIEYDMKELEKEANLHTAAHNEDMLRICATRMTRLKARYKRFINQLENIHLVCDSIQDAAMCETFARSLNSAHLSLSEALERIDVLKMEEIMDALRNEHADLDDIQSLLAVPLRMEHNPAEGEEVYLPDAPVEKTQSPKPVAVAE